MEYRVAMYMCMLKLKYLKYFKYAAKPMAGACMALAVTTTCLRSKLKIAFIVRQNLCVHAYQGSKHTQTQTTSHQPPPKGLLYKLTYIHV